MAPTQIETGTSRNSESALEVHNSEPWRKFATLRGRSGWRNPFAVVGDGLLRAFSESREGRAQVGAFWTRTR